MDIKHLTENLQENMLSYTLLTIVLGTVCGYFTKAIWISNLIMPIVFIMIYPMMVNVSFESLKNIRKSSKPLAVGLFINFIFAPLLILLLTSIFQVPHQIFMALIFLAIAPASSMGLGYVGLSKGEMITASIIVASAFILSIFIYPIVITSLGASSHHTDLLVGNITKSLLFVLVLPLILGLLTREYLIEKRNIEFKKVKPYFSFITLLFLYVLIFLIFYLKGPQLVEKISKIYNIILIAVLFYPLAIFFVLLLNKYILKFSYEHNQSIVFTTVSKNIALTIGLLTTSFGESGRFMALIPAMFSLIQILFVMSYLHFNERIKQWYNKNGTMQRIK